MQTRFAATSFALLVGAAILVRSGDADACGGCLTPGIESTQVTGHRMILSISKDQTTLWDQITYVGEPSSFAWVLPIRGEVKVGLSSSLLFDFLDGDTRVTVTAPTFTCPSFTCEDSSYLAGSGSATGTGDGTFAPIVGGGDEAPTVTVLDQEVVGPYETVQLSATDPDALPKWLQDHGYAIPSDVAPVISAYVSEGFNFLALKLVPGKGVSAMRPVRITTPGAGTVLPLRMVAAGTGAFTSISLWVVGEGRYEPANMPSFTIGADEVLWNWDTSASTYTTVRKEKFADRGGKGWLVEVAGPYRRAIEAYLSQAVMDHPETSGYGTEDQDPLQNAEEDAEAFLHGIAIEKHPYVTRLYGELSRDALVTDLEIGAAEDQSAIDGDLKVKYAVGRPPCPDPPPGCELDDSGGCSIGRVAGHSAGAGVLAAAAGIGLLRRRRRRLA